jgi:putative ABC transport system substrate-binding protein
MNRRAVLQLAGATLFAPMLVLAQTKPPPKIPRVAVIFVTSPPSEFVGPDPINPAMRAFVHGMRELGYVDGRNVILDLRSLEGRWERLEGMVADLVRLKTDVIHIPSTPLVARVAKLGTTIPIVASGTSDVVEKGLVQSLSRPGGNITGVTVDTGSDVEAKRLELLLEVVPKARRVAFLGTREEWESLPGDGVRSAARRLGVTAFYAGATTLDYASAIEEIRKEKPHAFFVSASPTSYGFRRIIGEFAASSGIPSSCPWSDLVDQGCLMSYGNSVQEIYRRVTSYVDKILKGAKPGELPIERPTKFELVINLKTAQATGVKIPQSVLLRVDRVVE